MMEPVPTADSPCQRICVLDPVTGLCIGCGRTTDEIGGWMYMSVEERIAVNALLPARREHMASREARGGRTRRPVR